ncbi:L-threonine 3-dehydrogenase [Fusarium oxysporum f. sp. cubense]|uniref:L-threonine 3-dehydrogenase n=1 Tax=Fusarium oxysporum f. sp. cubense TaxID=61366 RepID=A0A559L962_FUSOC|nr:L-threonine 3-dehydrogenase [Fusarium oxysporum f. sp. cubense]
MAQQQTFTLPLTQRALRQDERFQPLAVQNIQVPTAIPGSAVLRVLVADIISYSKQIYNGERNYSYPVPITPGSAAIGRVVALGQDAVKLKVGDLCFLDLTLKGRDSDGDMFLGGVNSGFTPGSQKLMADGGFRDGTHAEYVRFPLENVHQLDERRLLGSPDQGGFGYEIEDLLYINRMLVPYGGMSPLCVDVKPGETVVVSPATGAFGAAAVHVALELGAGKVIAMGRNTAVLEKVKAGEPHDKQDRVALVQLTGLLEKDLSTLNEAKGSGEIDVFYDTSPPMAQGSAHINAGIMALGRGGRACLMGGLLGDVTLAHLPIMTRNLTIKGKAMFEREDVKNMIKLVESGTIRLYHEANEWKMYRSHCVRKFALEDWEVAFAVADKASDEGNYVFIP